MKNSKKNFGKVGQNLAEKKPQKHDANLQKNSTLYFQIGLILCLLATYWLFELKFTHTIQKPYIAQTNDANAFIYTDETPVFTVEQPKTEEKIKTKKTKQITDKIEIVDNNTNVIENIVTTPTIDDKPITTKDLDGLIEEEPDDVIVNYIAIENVPVYPGCEHFKTNKKRGQCLSDKINRLVQKKFKTDLSSEYGLKGVQRIYTQFTINKYGIVSDINVRAPHPILEKEALRVITKIPKMQPGKQQNKAVGVIYSLPITFKVEN